MLVNLAVKKSVRPAVVETGPHHPRQAQRDPAWSGCWGKIIPPTETMSDGNTGIRGWSRLKEHRMR